MQDGSGPGEGAIRFAANGTLEVFDGTAWQPYAPPVDDGYGVVFKGIDPRDLAADDPADGHQ
jgi:hypothetical protein